MNEEYLVVLKGFGGEADNVEKADYQKELDMSCHGREEEELKTRNAHIHCGHVADSSHSAQRIEEILPDDLYILYAVVDLPTI